jgi:hypothetical protein
MTDVVTNGVPPSELAALQAAYQEILRRDGHAEQRAAQYRLLVWVLVAINLGLGV